MDNEFVSIRIDQWERLKRRDEWLECLEAAGVDNWQGMEEAISIAKETGFYERYDD